MHRDWIIHDSHDIFYRNPFGAVSCHTPITCRIKIHTSDCLDTVLLRVWKKEKHYRDIEMTLLSVNNSEKVYEGIIDASSVAGPLWYYFTIITKGRVFYYGNNLMRLGGKGLVQEQVPPSYQITVYQADINIPAWWQEGIVYQIFPDRFCNGLPDGKVLNPKKESLIHGCWDDFPQYIRDCRDNSILRWDFFGGNLEGIINKLSYLKELGISVIYLNPVFESPSNHRYDTGDYHKIDPMLGSNDTFRMLCQKAADLGIRIILDGVFSHTGSDSIYFNREGNYDNLGAYQSTSSPYYSWYRFYHWPHSYESWWGIGTLPNVNEMDPSYRDFITGKGGVIDYWMRMGVKGWRLDVADELPDEFIKGLRKAMREADPDSVLIGEVWEDASNKVSYGELRQYLWGEELDSVMNYPFRKILLDFLLGRLDARDTHRHLMSLYENYPQSYFYSAMNLVGSHDVPRALTILGEGEGECLHEVEKGRYRLNPRQRSLGIARLKLLVLMQMTFPGVPCVYYGDEAGMEGYADPFNRGPYPWEKEDRDLLGWYKKVIALRKEYPVLWSGQWLALYAEKDVYGYLRKQDEVVIAALFNRNAGSKVRIRVDLSRWGTGYWDDLLNEGEQIKADDRAADIEFLPLEGKVFSYGLNKQSIGKPIIM